jgi:nucleoside-diphosphate-sugar epimerase
MLLHCIQRKLRNSTGKVIGAHSPKGNITRAEGRWRANCENRPVFVRVPRFVLSQKERWMKKDQPADTLLLGAGYLGARVGKRLIEQGQSVIAVTRSPLRADLLSKDGFRVIIGDLAQVHGSFPIPAVRSILFAVGFDRSQGQTAEQVWLQPVRRLLAQLPASVQRFVYISTTGVYGDAEGGWLDEDSPTLPTRDSSRVALAVEQLLQSPPDSRDESSSSLETHPRVQSVVLRLAGIYGPGRVPQRESILSGEPIAANPDSFLNLIHVDDAIEVVLQALNPENLLPRILPCVINVADDHPVLRRDYYQAIADRYGVANVRFDTTAMKEDDRRRGSNKKVSNRRLKSWLKQELRYPDYRKGLHQIISSEASSADEVNHS